MIKKPLIDKISLNKDYSDNDLNTLKALILFGAYYLSLNFASAVAVLLFAPLYLSIHSSQFSKTDITDVIKKIPNPVSITGTFIGSLTALIIIIFLSKKLIKLSLNKRRIVDAAWVRGGVMNYYRGYFMEFSFPFFYLLFLDQNNF